MTATTDTLASSEETISQQLGSSICTTYRTAGNPGKNEIDRITVFTIK